jgi:peptidoglycan lytic transglycosylase
MGSVSNRSSVFALFLGSLALHVTPARAEVTTSGPRHVHIRPSSVPDEARRALEQGRFFHASLILREYLATVKDTTPEDRLLSARAEAGWGDWERVETLLAGQDWLDRLDGAAGCRLLGRSLFEAGKYEASVQSFSRYIERADKAAPVDRGIAELYRGHALRKLADPAAITAYDRAAGLLPDIADWIALDAVEVAVETGDTAAVRTRLAAIDPELAIEWGWRSRVRAFQTALDPAGARRAAADAAGALRSTNRRAEAFVLAGTLAFDQGDVEHARTAFRQAMNAAPGGTGGVDGARMLSDMPGITPDDRLLIGRTYIRHGNYPRGITGITAYLNAGRGTATERERLRFELGQAQFRSGRYDDAEKTFLGIVERNIIGSLAADALLLAGRSQYRDGRVARGRKTLLDVVARYPTQDAAPEALYLAADLDQDDDRFDLAAERFRKTTTLSRDVEEVGLAHMRLGGMAFEKGDFAGALAEFDGYRSRYPNGRRYVQATYWAALAARRAGDDARATDRLEEVFRMDPLSYYGGLAADLLGKSFADVPLNASPQTAPALIDEVRSALRRVDLLRKIDRNDAADYEVGRVRQRFAASKSSTYTLAEELAARGYTVTAIGIGWDLFRRDGGWNDRLLRIIYPFPFRTIITAEAEESDVDPYLAAGLIRQESMFNVDAVSGPGAVGLMQVLPATGRTLAQQLGIRHFDTELLRHPELNAHLGMRYLADQLADFDDRLPVVLAAYNAGPHRIDRWQQFPEFSDDELFAERIPFAETRDYVKIVQNNARIYRALYPPVVQ